MKRALALASWMVLATPSALAQTALDRADPTLIQRTLPPPAATPQEGPPSIAAPVAPASAAAPVTGIVRAITVDGQDRLPPATFADAIAPRLGIAMSQPDLAALAGAVAQIARDRGYPFATAQVPAQSMAGGILHVTLDLGRIDAVRIVGARSVAADRVLAAALVTGGPLRRADLERALLLVGDMPGLRVTGSRLVRQDGFGILLVTVEADRRSAYVQIDNRGSDEVGPVRSTLIATAREVAQSGDEVTLIASQTPLQPSEFVFVRARYAAPLDARGTIATVSGSIARSRPGGSLTPLKVEGNSADAAIGVQHPLLRTRARSLWLGGELRAIGTDQYLLGSSLRRDRLVTLSGTLTGAAMLAGGAARAELTTNVGLPVGAVTRAGSPLASRSDGDARFATLSFAADWTTSLGKPFSLVVAGAGQLASRPLLAVAEIGLGGPAFGRGYDYAERTGDQGILGAVELRADIGRLPGGIVDRTQLYGFVDGGTVGNLRGGEGGGSLMSTGMGARIGTGRFDWLVEVALPVTDARFDTGDHSPRISLRLARAF